MTKYSGTRSLDAEIILDFKDGAVLMDYSQNNLGSPYNSNTSATLKSEYRKQSGGTRFLYELYKQYVVLPAFLILQLLIMPSMSFVGRRGLVSGETQYRYQKFLKYVMESFQGIYIQYTAGSYDRNWIEYIIPMNTWFEYRLNGDYKKYISKISLLRNFGHFEKFGKFEEVRQHGWKVRFDFSQVPKEGYCEIHHL